MVVAVADSTIAPSTQTPYEDTLVQQLWHSIEEVLHIREPAPPPVPPKDERWLVHTVDLSISQQHEDDAHFWDKLATKLTHRHLHPHHHEIEQESVSIDLPVEAAMNHLGKPGNKKQIQDQKIYFQRMARLCQQKFEQDQEQMEEIESMKGSTVSKHEHRHQHVLSNLRNRLHHSRRLGNSSSSSSHRGKLDYAPKVDPEEMRAAHQLLYGHQERSTSISFETNHGHHSVEKNESEESWGQSMFGLWWGHRRHLESKNEDSLGVDDWEKVDIPKNKTDQSRLEENGYVISDSRSDSRSQFRPQSYQQGHLHHRHFRRTSKTPSILSAATLDRYTKDNHKSTLRRHQALAAAAAYEAMKAYQAKRIRQGKKVSHGEMKAVLAGMAMAEAVKLLESKHDHSYNHEDQDSQGNDDTVAEAGSKVLKLFELWRSPQD
ncbi:hypothetical protein BGZ83_004802 [Gryganskiella cystojenkinii]|nr:hypothetical protein BGZ83_004802 [Gryganskiella cystojenkinii]